MRTIFSLWEAMMKGPHQLCAAFDHCGRPGDPLSGSSFSAASSLKWDVRE